MWSTSEFTLILQVSKLRWRNFDPNKDTPTAPPLTLHTFRRAHVCFMYLKSRICVYVVRPSEWHSPPLSHAFFSLLPLPVSHPLGFSWRRQRRWFTLWIRCTFEGFSPHISLFLSPNPSQCLHSSFNSLSAAYSLSFQKLQSLDFFLLHIRGK